MKLGECQSVKDVIEWLQKKGLSPSENAIVGTVYPVHTASSWHYKVFKDGKVVDGPEKTISYKGQNVRVRQGKLGIDLNDNNVSDDKFGKKMTDETAALTHVYFRILQVAEAKNWPLAEAFFWKWGFKAQAGYDVNVPISGHDTHAHFGFSKSRW